MTDLMRTQGKRRAMLSVALLAGLAGLTGCDYWPPALQAQIEQLKAEVQAAVADKANLENQLKESVKVKDEAVARLEELTKLNRELATNVASLKQALDAEREKTAKAVKGTTKAAHAKAAGKAPASHSTSTAKKPSAKTQPKKKG